MFHKAFFKALTSIDLLFLAKVIGFGGLLILMFIFSSPGKGISIGFTSPSPSGGELGGFMYSFVSLSSSIGKFSLMFCSKRWKDSQSVLEGLRKRSLKEPTW